MLKSGTQCCSSATHLGPVLPGSELAGLVLMDRPQQQSAAAALSLLPLLPWVSGSRLPSRPRNALGIELELARPTWKKRRRARAAALHWRKLPAPPRSPSPTRSALGRKSEEAVLFNEDEQGEEDRVFEIVADGSSRHGRQEPAKTPTETCSFLESASRRWTRTARARATKYPITRARTATGRTTSQEQARNKARTTESEERRGLREGDWNHWRGEKRRRLPAGPH